MDTSKLKTQNLELRVFISSTFRDLQEEREHLVKKIFPEIRSLCRERGIRFTEVDLRWGLTDEEVALGQVIRTCLEEVDKCRPYFIGITGDRYGFIPTHLDIYKDPTLLELHPWIEDAANDQMSITEMEAQYAVLRRTEDGGRRAEDGGRRTEEGESRINNNIVDALPSPVFGGGPAEGRGGSRARALFYFRLHRESLDDNDREDVERSRLEAYQQRIRHSGATIEHFRDPVSLGELIYNDLIKIIKQDFADARPPTPLEQERSRHAAFSLSRRRAYIPNPVYLKRLTDHVASDEPPLIVYAESGSGKSSLFAFWAEQYRRKNPEAHVIEHYVGIGATATAHYAIIRHICMEIKERFGREEEIPSDPTKLDFALGQWFGLADHELNARGERMVLILDGLNQLRGEALNLRWIPDVISPRIRVMISSTVEGTLVELQKRGWSRYGMQALTEAERETIVVRYLAEYHKSLNPEQIKRIATNYKCGHPLFLKTVLEELRLVGLHEELDAKIESYLEATGTEDLFQRVLERLEDDYSQRSVRDVMSLLSACRSGLDERELFEISGIARLKIATMMAGLDYHLVRKDGRLTFFHDYLRRAVENRYLADEDKRRSAHMRIADYFDKEISASIASNGNVPVRMASELAYQLHTAGAQDRLVECLTNILVLDALYSGETRNEVLRYWSNMSATVDVAEAYGRSLASWSLDDMYKHSRGLAIVSDLFQRLSQWPAAIALERKRLELAVEHGWKREEAASHGIIGWLSHLRGDNSAALAEIAKSLEQFTALGEGRFAAAVTGNLGGIYRSQGQSDLAMEYWERQLRIAEESGYRDIISVVVGNMGMEYLSRGDQERAFECFERKLRICEELGDRSGVASAIGKFGVIYQSRGECDRALESFEHQMTIAEELGDRRLLAGAIGSIGGVHVDLGETDRAIECYDRQMAMWSELGAPRAEAISVGNKGLSYLRRGNIDLAIECFERSIAVHSELSFPFGMTYWLEGRGRLLLEECARDAMPPYLRNTLPGATPENWRAAALKQARTDAEKCLAISLEMHKSDTMMLSQALLARLDAAEGKLQEALERLAAQLAEATDMRFRAELSYWRWKLTKDQEPEFGEQYLQETLQLHQELCKTFQNFEFRKRLDELTAAARATEESDATAE